MILLESMPRRKEESEISVELRAKAYIMALEGEFVEDLDEVLRGLIRGEGDERFAPYPPELARKVRAVRFKRKYDDCTMDALPLGRYPFPSPPKPDERKRIGEKLMALSKAFGRGDMDAIAKLKGGAS